MRNAPTGSVLGGAIPPRGLVHVRASPELVSKLSAIAISPASPFGDGATVVVGVGVGVGVGVAVGVVTTVFVVVSDAASVGLALLVPHADARVSSPRAATLSDRCARM